MTTNRLLALALLGLATLSPQCSTLHAQGTEFTYQGRLIASPDGSGFTGTVEFQFTLWNAASAGNRVGVTNTILASATNGLFTVPLDFGSAAFTGADRWLQIEARTTTGPFTPLNPRQRLTATPYAFYAGKAMMLDGALPGGQLAGSYSNVVTLNNPANVLAGNGSGLSGLDASQLANGTVPLAALSNAWKINGNAGTIGGSHFLGTTDNQPLDLRVNGVRALRLQPNPSGLPSVIGGELNNVERSVFAATIGGGYLNRIQTNANYSTIAGGWQNTIHSNAQYAGIGGGLLNAIWTNAFAGTVGGGEENVIQTGAWYATIGGGVDNAIQAGAIGGTVAGGNRNTIQTNGIYATLGGGSDNTILSDGQFATLGGGRNNTNGGSHATVPGGERNAALGHYSLAAGRRAKAIHPGAFVWADSQDVDISSISANEFLVRATGGVRFLTSGTGMTLDGQSVLSGNVATEQLADSAVTATKLADGATLSEILDDDGPGSGLNADLLDGLDSAAFWNLGGNAGTTAGMHFLGTTDNQPLEVKVNNSRVLRFEPDSTEAPNLIGGSRINVVDPGVRGATIAGGGVFNYEGGVSHMNRIASDFGTIGGGFDHLIEDGAQGATIAGGRNNLIQSNALYATIGGGWQNTVQRFAHRSTIAGGWLNTIQSNATRATIGGGSENRIQHYAEYATIGGGRLNTIQPNAVYATIGGGWDNTIQTNARNATIGGGEQNSVQTNADFATISGGVYNTIQPDAHYATIGGGLNNTVHFNAQGTTIGGGDFNSIQTNASSATIGGGGLNVILYRALAATIGGGEQNTIRPDAFYATIGGGRANTIQTQAFYATIPGGRDNSATNSAFAAGTRAKANHTGSFVWGDSTFADFASTANNQFLIRASGGVGIGTTAPGNPLAVQGTGTDLGAGIGAGSVVARFKATNPADTAVSVEAQADRNAVVYLSQNGLAQWGLWYNHGSSRRFDIYWHGAGGGGAGGDIKLSLQTNGNMCVGGTVTTCSDRERKANFQPVDSRAVLEQVARLPITRWNYRADAETPHIGPMAQDFHAAFDVGEDDKHISTTDAAGVALAAIQGLNQKVEQQHAENAVLKQRLAALEQLVSKLTGE